MEVVDAAVVTVAAVLPSEEELPVAADAAAVDVSVDAAADVAADAAADVAALVESLATDTVVEMVEEDWEVERGSSGTSTNSSSTAEHYM